MAAKSFIYYWDLGSQTLAKMNPNGRLKIAGKLWLIVSNKQFGEL